MLKSKTEENDKMQLESRESLEWKRKYYELENEMQKIALIEEKITNYLPTIRNYEEIIHLKVKKIEEITL